MRSKFHQRNRRIRTPRNPRTEKEIIRPDTAARLPLKPLLARGCSLARRERLSQAHYSSWRDPVHGERLPGCLRLKRAAGVSLEARPSPGPGQRGGGYLENVFQFSRSDCLDVPPETATVLCPD